MFKFQAILQKLKQLKDFRLNSNIVTYLIFVGVASVLWFMNALNQEYTAEISYPVKYTNLPENKYPVIQLPSQIQLELKAKGFALLRYRIRTSFLPITFNVSSYSAHVPEKNGVLEFTLNTNDIKDKINNQLGKEIEVVGVIPEQIIFKFARAETKKIAIRPVLEYTLKRQYILNRINVIPDSVMISGPSLVIDTLRYVGTRPIQLKNISKNITCTTELADVPDCNARDIPITVEIEVEQFTESQKNIPVKAVNIPDSLTIRLFPDNVNISYEVGLSKYDKVSANDFVFTVAYPQSTEDTYLEIKVEKVPPFIKNLSYSPQKVEYILEKK